MGDFSKHTYFYNFNANPLMAIILKIVLFLGLIIIPNTPLFCQKPIRLSYLDFIDYPNNWFQIDSVPKSFHINLSKYLDYIEHPFTVITVDTLEDISKIHIGEGTLLSVYFSDLKGACKFEIRDPLNVLLIRGEYENALMPFRHYTLVVNVDTGEESMEVKEHYEPLKSGVWEYYDEKGILLETEYYNRGILQDK